MRRHVIDCSIQAKARCQEESPWESKAKEGAVNQGLGVREDLEALRTALSSGKADAGMKEGWGRAQRQR